MTTEAVLVNQLKRRPNPVDPDQFQQRVLAAVAAFGTDVTYAVHMARAAVTISRKRAMWSERKNSVG